MNFEMIELPLEEAIELEVKQNMERDKSLGDVSEKEILSMRMVYEEEARLSMEQFGAGYEPDVPHLNHKLVKVKLP